MRNLKRPEELKAPKRLDVDEDDIDMFFDDAESEVADARARGQTHCKVYTYPLEHLFVKVRNGFFSRTRIKILNERVKQNLADAGYEVHPCFDSDYIKLTWEEKDDSDPEERVDAEEV